MVMHGIVIRKHYKETSVKSQKDCITYSLELEWVWRLDGPNDASAKSEMSISLFFKILPELVSILC